MSILRIQDDLEWGSLSVGVTGSKKTVKFCIWTNIQDKDQDVLSDEGVNPASTDLYRNFTRLPQCGEQLTCIPSGGTIPVGTGLYATRVTLDLLQVKDENPLAAVECPDFKLWEAEVCFERTTPSQSVFGPAVCTGVQTVFQDIPSLYDADGKLVANTACDLLGGFTIPVAIQRFKFCKNYPINAIPAFFKSKNGAVNSEAIRVFGCEVPSGYARLIVDDIELTTLTDAKTSFEYHTVCYQIHVNPLGWWTRLANAGYTFKKYQSCTARVRLPDMSVISVTGEDCFGLKVNDDYFDAASTTTGTVISVDLEYVEPTIQGANGPIPNPDVSRISKCNVNDENQENITSPQLLDKHGRLLDVGTSFRLLELGGAAEGNIDDVQEVITGSPIPGTVIGYKITMDPGDTFDFTDDLEGADLIISCADASDPTDSLIPFTIVVPILSVAGPQCVTVPAYATYVQDFFNSLASSACRWRIENVACMLTCWKYPRTSFEGIDTCSEPVLCDFGPFTADFDNSFAPGTPPTDEGVVQAVQFGNGVAYYRSALVEGDLVWVFSSFQAGGEK